VAFAAGLLFLKHRCHFTLLGNNFARNLNAYNALGSTGKRISFEGNKMKTQRKAAFYLTAILFCLGSTFTAYTLATAGEIGYSYTELGGAKKPTEEEKPTEKPKEKLGACVCVAAGKATCLENTTKSACAQMPSSSWFEGQSCAGKVK
jgi:hypothetical protein